MPAARLSSPTKSVVEKDLVEDGVTRASLSGAQC